MCDWPEVPLEKPTLLTVPEQNVDIGVVIVFPRQEVLGPL